MNIRSLTLAAAILLAPTFAFADGPADHAGSAHGQITHAPFTHVQFRDRDDRRFDRDDRRRDFDRDRDHRRFDRDDRGRRFFRGRWWDYGVGPCWRILPNGAYVWVCY